MQFKPTYSELINLSNMDATERLQYFLTRSIETEEIWALSDTSGWILREQHDKIVLQLWPYQQLASDYAAAHEESYIPSATSLDHFVHSLLSNMIDQGIELEILPVKKQAGSKIMAAKLSELYESLLDAGDYYLEG